VLPHRSVSLLLLVAPIKSETVEIKDETDDFSVLGHNLLLNLVCKHSTLIFLFFVFSLLFSVVACSVFGTVVCKLSPKKFGVSISHVLICSESSHRNFCRETTDRREEWQGFSTLIFTIPIWVTTSI